MRRFRRRLERRFRGRYVVLFALATALLAILLYSVYGLRGQDALAIGERSPQDFVAPVAVEIIDPIATEKARSSVRSQIDTIYSSDPDLEQLALDTITSAGLPSDVETFLLTNYRNPDGVSDFGRSSLIERAVSMTPTERKRDVRLLLESRLISTAVPNLEMTAAARNAAANAVDDITQTVEAGETIVRTGEVLTEDKLRVLEQLGLYSAREDISQRQLLLWLGCFLLAFVLMIPMIYLARRLKELTFTQIAFLIGITFFFLAIQRLSLFLSPHFFFLALMPILIAVLLNERTAVLWAGWLAVVAALLDPSVSMFTLLTTLTSGTTAAFFAKRLSSRSSLLFAGVLGGLVGVLSYALLLLLNGSTLTVASLSNLLLLLSGNVLAGILALGLLPLAESGFDFLTEFRLVELSNPSSPLLQKLLLEAPGTYQHSLIISNLVEQAVSAIGGDSLLARVGCLYHDVGKLKRPQFYIENQIGNENPHNAISPHLSYLIITSHVKDGIELLREYKLPKALEPFVSEHHGTTVLSYFYKRALEDSARLDELNFRYPGPKPQTKETAVLMLADAVESASRTLTDPSQGSIRALIDRLISLRQQDGQLAESPLNFRDLETIANTFERMLTAILHRRIQYPTDEPKAYGGDSRRNQPLSVN
jgi:cyclic-di-AMP phosphodiesterase PgpH